MKIKSIVFVGDTTPKLVNIECCAVTLEIGGREFMVADTDLLRPEIVNADGDGDEFPDPTEHPVDPFISVLPEGAFKGLWMGPGDSINTFIPQLDGRLFNALLPFKFEGKTLYLNLVQLEPYSDRPEKWLAISEAGENTWGHANGIKRSEPWFFLEKKDDYVANYHVKHAGYVSIEDVGIDKAIANKLMRANYRSVVYQFETAERIDLDGIVK